MKTYKELKLTLDKYTPAAEMARLKEMTSDDIINSGLTKTKKENGNEKLL